MKETFVGGRINQFNLGGRFIDERKSIDECQVQSDIAGATTLQNALESLCGYDAVWRPWAQEFPGVTPPWLSHLTGNQDNIETIVATKPKGYMELIFGFSDVDKCINSLINFV